MSPLAAIDLKLARDMWHRRGQVLAIALVIASAVATLVMALSALRSLSDAREAYYDRQRFAQVFVSLKRAPESAAARLGSDRVQVFDTARAAGGQGLLTMLAAELAAQGETRERIVAELERLKPQTLVWAAARDVRHAVRGGRVPRWVGPLAEWLGLTPIAQVTAQGTLKVGGALFGKRAVPSRMAGYVVKRVPPGQRWRLIVGHGDCPDDGHALLEALRERLDCTESWLVETGPAVGAHAGPGTLVVSLQPVRENGDG